MSAFTSSQERVALVVDDDQVIRMDVAEMLEQAGFRCLEADHGDAAIEVLENYHLDVTLMFSDVDMPGSRDGFALAREVAIKWPHISMVVASGRVRPAQGDLPDGATFIGKPFSVRTVHEHLKETLPEDSKPASLKGQG